MNSLLFLAGVPTWIWIVVTLAIVIAVYLLSELVLFLLMRSSMKKAFHALDELVPFERERSKKIDTIYQTLKDGKRINNRSMEELLESNKDILSQSSIDMQKLKSQDDFLILYLLKFMKEKKLKQREEYSPLYKELEAISYPDPKANDFPYKRYNDLALRYNSYTGMGMLRSIASRKKYLAAPVL